MNIQNGMEVPFRSHVPFLLCLMGMHLLNVLSRIVFAPLMPTIEGDLGIGHGNAGSFFLFISLGYSTGLFGSGFIASHLTHRRTIILSSLAAGGSLIAVSLSHNLWEMRCGLMGLGLSTGFYFPSGVAALTAMVSARDWGKAFGIHQLAPNLGFVATPLLVEGLMTWFSWRGVIAIIGVIAIAVGVAFARFGKGGNFSGVPPTLQALRLLIRLPSLWVLISFFSIGLGAYLGIYNMLPLYLVAYQGMERGWANTLIALSWIAGLGIVFPAGWATDLLGPRRALGVILLTTGIATLLLGLVKGGWIIPVLFLQPMLATCFPAAGLTALSRIGPHRIRNVAVSFTIQVAFLLGAGVLPAGIGILGEAGFFSLGIILVGLMLMGSTILLRYLEFQEDKDRGSGLAI
jgi:NNP family nitrate/nitrite transporter-like MFS transporter